MVFLAGGDCVEDIQEHQKSEVLQIPNLKVCLPDTIGRVLKSLSEQKEVHLGNSDMEHQFSGHQKLNTFRFFGEFSGCIVSFIKV